MRVPSVVGHGPLSRACPLFLVTYSSDKHFFLLRLEDDTNLGRSLAFLLLLRGGVKHVGATQCMYTVYLDPKKL